MAKSYISQLKPDIVEKYSSGPETILETWKRCFSTFEQLQIAGTSSIIRVSSCHLRNMFFTKLENNFKFLERVISRLLFCKKWFGIRFNIFKGHLPLLDFVFVFDLMIGLVFTLFTLFIAQERGTGCWRCLRSSPRSARRPRPGRQSIEMALIAFFSRKSWLHFFLQNHLKSFDRLAFPRGSHSIPRLSDCFVWVPSLRAGVKKCQKMMVLPLTSEILPWENLPLF